MTSVFMRKAGRLFLIHPSVQASLTQKCLKLTIAAFSYNLLPASCGDIGFLYISIGLVLASETRPQSAFTAFMALRPSANYL
jgi:hypothetical protein